MSKKEIPSPMPAYFMVKVNIKKQAERKEKIGMFYTSPEHQYMIYNTEWGEVVGIGTKANRDFPEVEIGDTLIYHHFVQNESKEKAKEKHLIHEDDEYYYYLVTSSSFNGRRNETYGVIKGNTIIPHPDFIFLELDRPKETYASIENFEGAKMSISKGGLLLFSQWESSEEEITDKMQKIKSETQNLAKHNLHRPGVAQAVLRKEEEMEMLSRELNRIKILPYTVYKTHYSLSEKFKKNIKQGDIIYVEDKAAEKIVSVRDKKYRVVPIQYISYTKK